MRFGNGNVTEMQSLVSAIGNVAETPRFHENRTTMFTRVGNATEI